VCLKPQQWASFLVKMFQDAMNLKFAQERKQKKM
jgi:hypothetical protein